MEHYVIGIMHQCNFNTNATKILTKQDIVCKDREMNKNKLCKQKTFKFISKILFTRNYQVIKKKRF